MYGGGWGEHVGVYVIILTSNILDVGKIHETHRFMYKVSFWFCL